MRDSALGGMISFAVLIIATALALYNDQSYNTGKRTYWKWGASSERQLLAGSQAFDAKGVLYNALLANSPQLLLSISYVALNRICTSMCFIGEWNDHAIRRKPLRVTTPVGQQRPSYFLQLPYRWAVPLTIMSGLLHWLLSQSIFLVRLDVRYVDGNLIKNISKSTCGYSSLSLVVFSLTYFLLLSIVYGLRHRLLHIAIPPVEHCSLMISAACHPPPDDVDPQLGLVQWGVVRSRFGGDIRHCSFMSEKVSPPEEGMVYT